MRRVFSPWMGRVGGDEVSALRDYQVAAKAAVLEGWKRHRSQLLVLATGCGKTYVAAEIIRERAPLGRTLWLAHRSELLDQARSTFEDRIGLRCDIEKASSRAPIHGDLYGANPVVVASVQTLRGGRLKCWPRDAFATIVVDEAHHAAAAGYRAILAHFPGAQVLGLTATPDRGDGKALEIAFDHVSMRYGMREAIEDGWLCPIVQKTIECASIDISDVKTVRGDLSERELQQRMELDAVHHESAGPIVRESAGRPTLVFCSGVAASKQLTAILGGYMPPEQVVQVDGETPAEIRRDRLRDFRAGAVRVLVNVGVLTEGYDCPSVACVAILRPTKSRALYEQMIGRGTRLSPDKPDLLVLDFMGNAGRHKLVTPIDILGGDKIKAAGAERAQELAEEGKPSEEALKQAEREAIERERKAEERRIRAARIEAESAYQATAVDPFGSVPRSSGPGISEAQIAEMRRLGFRLPPRPYYSRDQAREMIDRAKARAKKGMCTPAQTDQLVRRGLRADITKKQASEVMSRLAAVDWDISRDPDLRATYGYQREMDAAE